MAVGEGGVELDLVVEDVGERAEGAVVGDGEDGEGGAAVRGGDGPLAVLADVEVLRRPKCGERRAGGGAGWGEGDSRRCRHLCRPC